MGTGAGEYSLEDLAPLLGILGFVFLVTAAVSYARTDYSLMGVGKVFMASFFLVFGGFKAYNLSGFREAFRKYDLLAARSNRYANIYPFIEIILGFLYVATLVYSSLVLEVLVYVSTFLLMAFGGLGVFHALYRGKDLECACLGKVFNVPVTGLTLVEDLGMAVMALLMLAAVL